MTLKYVFNPFTGNFDAVDSISNPLVFKGSIAVNTDFPLIANVQNGWFYTITANVTDNAGVTYTNTGQSFVLGDEIVWNGIDWTNVGSVRTNKRAITVLIDGQGIPPTTGSKGFVRIPYNGVITGWSITGNVSGSCVIDVKKCSYANYPTTASIAGSEKPTLSSVIKNQDLNLTTWTTSLTAGDWVEIYLVSVSTLTKIFLSIDVEASD